MPSFRGSYARITLAAAVAWLVLAKTSRAAEKAADIGVILAATGKPTLQDTSGRAAPSAVMQPVREDDVMLFASGDSVTICNELLGSTIEISGPGTVRLTRAGVVSITGSAAIKNAGRCEASATGDTDGGVILRTLTPGQPPR